jgi:hypothetical protein
LRAITVGPSPAAGRGNDSDRADESLSKDPPVTAQLPPPRSNTPHKRNRSDIEPMAISTLTQS